MMLFFCIDVGDLLTIWMLYGLVWLNKYMTLVLVFKWKRDVKL